MAADRVVVVPPGDGHRIGNVEFLARPTDTPRFNLSIVTMRPQREGPDAHVHGTRTTPSTCSRASSCSPSTTRRWSPAAGDLILVPPGLRHSFANRSDELARFLNLHAPAGFDLRLEED